MTNTVEILGYYTTKDLVIVVSPFVSLHYVVNRFYHVHITYLVAGHFKIIDSIPLTWFDVYVTDHGNNFYFTYQEKVLSVH